MRSRGGSVGLALAAIAAAGTARAQMPSPDAPPVAPSPAPSPPDVAPGFAVELEASQPDVTILVDSGTGSLPCGQRCVLQLPQGRYRVVASGASGRLSAMHFVVNEPSRVLVTPASDNVRTASFVLMPIGAAALATGVVLLWYALIRRFIEGAAECPQGCADSNQSTTFFYAGAISAGVGVVAGVTGLALWKKSKHASVDVEPLRARSAGSARLRLQPTAGLRWAGMALTGAF